MDCPIGRYQDLPGQASCLQCAEDETTGQTGSVRKEDCYVDLRMYVLYQCKKKHAFSIYDNAIHCKLR